MSFAVVYFQGQYEVHFLVKDGGGKELVCLDFTLNVKWAFAEKFQENK